MLQSNQKYKYGVLSWRAGKDIFESTVLGCCLPKLCQRNHLHQNIVRNQLYCTLQHVEHVFDRR